MTATQEAENFNLKKNFAIIYIRTCISITLYKSVLFQVQILIGIEKQVPTMCDSKLQWKFISTQS